MNRKFLSRGAIAVAVALAVSGGYVAGTRHADPQIITAAHAAPMMPAEAAAKTGIPDFSGLVEAYGPAVVNISAKHVVKRTAHRVIWIRGPVEIEIVRAHHSGFSGSHADHFAKVRWNNYRIEANGTRHGITRSGGPRLHEDRHALDVHHFLKPAH